MSFIIRNLTGGLINRDILKDVSLTIEPGKIHVLMGPNGSGKSTLAAVLMGHPGYHLRNNQYEISLNGIDLKALKTDERARLGLFLAFQNPISVPGVTVTNLLRTVRSVLHKKTDSDTKQTKHNPVLSVWDYHKEILENSAKLKIPPDLLKRGLNQEFSGGEKKKLEMLQAVMLNPKYAIFDEIDTGLDVDALEVVATGIDLLKKKGTGILIITHYQRILKYATPDFVHVLVNGTMVASGNRTLAEDIERNGYGKWTKESSD